MFWDGSLLPATLRLAVRERLEGSVLDRVHPNPAVAPEAEAAAVPGRSLSVPMQATLLVVFAGVLLIGLFGLPAIIGHAAPAPPPDAAATGSAFTPTDQQWAALLVQPVSRLNAPSRVQADGRIALDDDVSTAVFSPSSGRVTRVIAQPGDVVAAGAPLFAVQSAELAQAENDMISSLGILNTARAQLDLARVNENRQHLLYLGHGAAQKDWQQSRVDLATAQAGLGSAAIAVAAVRNRLAILGLSPADISRLEATRDPLRASADTIVRAPIAGTITQRQISLGQNIVGTVASAGAASPVFVISDLARLWMVASAPETDAALIHVGDLARVTVPAYPGRAFDARVVFVSPVIDPATHRLLVRATVANPDGALKPDMLAQFQIITGNASPTLAVPARAVVYEGADAHVWLADPVHKTLALRPIVAGDAIDAMVPVLSGLSATDHIVTSGAVFIDRTLSGGGD